MAAEPRPLLHEERITTGFGTFICWDPARSLPPMVTRGWLVGGADKTDLVRQINWIKSDGYDLSAYVKDLKTSGLLNKHDPTRLGSSYQRPYMLLIHEKDFHPAENEWGEVVP